MTPAWWVSCQLGAREHYAVPRALHSAGVLAELVTDAWAPPGSVTGWIGPPRVRERFHPDLARVKVAATNLSTLAFETRNLFADWSTWESIIRRNDWFQRSAVRALEQISRRHPAQKLCLFSYSYAARRLFEFAKTRGWTTVLGQIDPGPTEDRIVARLHQHHPDLAGYWRPAPSTYWKGWREECRLADRVIVNSEWSRRAMFDEGIDDSKIRIVPLAYDAPPDAKAFQRSYPERFTTARPMRVLFLGQVGIRKGMAAILDAMNLLRNEPIEFEVVGPVLMNVPAADRTNPRVHWRGSVPRSHVSHCYQSADVFLFPTFSDGFGLTQLEAQAWKLPVIASEFCGDVVHDGLNGRRLSDVSGVTIASTLRSLAADPGRLAAMSQASGVSAKYRLDAVGPQLLDAVR